MESRGSSCSQIHLTESDSFLKITYNIKLVCTVGVCVYLVFTFSWGPNIPTIIVMPVTRYFEKCRKFSVMGRLNVL